MPAPGHPPVNPTRVTGFRHDGKGGAISRAGEGAGIGWFWKKRATRVRVLRDGSYGAYGSYRAGSEGRRLRGAFC